MCFKFLKNPRNLDYDHAKDSSSKGSKSNLKNFRKRVDKIRNPLLTLPPIENEKESDD